MEEKVDRAGTEAINGGGSGKARHSWEDLGFCMMTAQWTLCIKWHVPCADFFHYLIVGFNNKREKNIQNRASSCT